MDTRRSRAPLTRDEGSISTQRESPSDPIASHFTVLDSWRGLCALLVALRHIPVESHLYDAAFVRNSYLFVDFFFVLSGFVITHTYVHKLRGSRDAADFAIRRFARLWPLHMVVLLAFVVLMAIKFLMVSVFDVPVDQEPFSGIYTLGGLVTSILFIHPFGFHSAPVWNRPSWSVGTEFYTYLLFAAVCLAAERLPSHRYDRGTVKAILAGALVFLSAALAVTLSSRGMDVTTGIGFFRCVYGFFVGHLAYRLWQLGKFPLIGTRAVEITVAALAFGFVAVAGYGPLSFLAPLVFALVIGVFVQEHGPVSRIMKAPAFVSLGRWSYAIYMIHAFIFAALIAFAQIYERDTGRELVQLVASHGDGGPTQALVFSDLATGDVLVAALLLFVVACAAWTYRAIERPAQRYFNGKLLPWVAPGFVRSVTSRFHPGTPRKRGRAA